MDKVEDVKRGGSSRFSTAMRQTGFDCDGSGDSSGVLDKSSKKEKRLRKLSCVGKISEMDTTSGATNSNKRLKLPKKFFYDNDTVNHAAIPRKLRSAVKRRRDFASPSLSNSGDESHRSELPPKVHMKKRKLNPEEQQNSDRSAKEPIVAEEITKDEEVAMEALFALAGTGINPETDKAEETDFNNDASEAEPLTLPDGSKTSCQTPRSNEVSNTPPKLESSVGEIMQNETLKEAARPADLNLGTGFPEATIEEHKNSGSGVRVGLPSSALPTAETCAPFLRPFSAKLPAWLGNATQPCSSERVSLAKPDSVDAVTIGKKSWKRCSAHVHICRLIKVLQTTEGREFRMNEGSQQGEAHIIAHENPHNIMNAYAKCSSEAQNAVPLHRRLFQDQQQACTALHKQTLNMIPLSAGGGCGTEASNFSDSQLNREAVLKQFHTPYLNSIALNQTMASLKHPPNRYSPSVNDHLSATAAQQVAKQLPPYFGSPLYDPSQWPTPLMSKLHMWGNQFMPGAHYPIWQNTRNSVFPPLASSSVGMFSTKNVQSSALEVPGFKNPQNTHQQQQQYIPIAPLLASNKGKMQFSPVPPVYDRNGGVLLVNGSQSLKMTLQ